jgi:hypothetical protein
MKSLSTFTIAVTLFVLCLIEKEAKQRDLKAQKSSQYLADSLNINIPEMDAPAYADFQTDKNNFPYDDLPTSQLVVSDSTVKALEPTPFLGKLPLLGSF